MTYDYKCEKCGATRRVERSIHETSNAPDCKKCNQPMIRIYGSPAISFRGSGWGRG